MLTLQLHCFGRALFSLKAPEESVIFLDLNVWVNSKSDHPPPPPGQTPGHLTFLKMPDQIPRYMGRFLGQMPHWLGLKSHRVGFFFCIR